jgi:hypothetical protein
MRANSQRVMRAWTELGTPDERGTPADALILIPQRDDSLTRAGGSDDGRSFGVGGRHWVTAASTRGISRSGRLHRSGAGPESAQVLPQADEQAQSINPRSRSPSGSSEAIRTISIGTVGLIPGQEANAVPQGCSQNPDDPFVGLGAFPMPPSCPARGVCVLRLPGSHLRLGW